jgi:hypothetical protein
MLRLGMMTRRRCQVVGLAERRFNPNLRMLMVVNPIDAMLTTWLKLPAAGITCSSQLGAPSSAFAIVAPAAHEKQH